MIKTYLIRPPEPDFLRHPIYGKNKYVCFRYNGGEWIEDDGEPDLAFVVKINGWPFAYGAEWPRCEWRSDKHPNNAAYRAAMRHCCNLYHVANGRRLKPLEGVAA